MIAVRDAAADGPSRDASTIDAPVGVPDAPVGVPDAPVGVPDAPLVVPDAAEIPDAPLVVPDAAEIPDAFIADAFVADALDLDAALKQLKAFRFTMNAEDLVQSFASEGAAMVFKEDDGDPPGSLAFTAIAPGTIKVISAAEVSWEAWGVPAGATVVQVRLASYKRRLAAISDMDSSWAFQIVGKDNLPAHDGVNGAYLELTGVAHNAQDAWETVDDLEAFEVLPAYRASDTPLFVKIWFFPLFTGAIDWRLDEIELEITYLAP
jgi:hypothetical protein